MSGMIKPDHTATSVPPEYHLDNLYSQATKPRNHDDAYYSWKRGADNSMPTRPPPPPLLDRVYRSCCCGTVAGLIAWVIVVILLVAGITALIVKMALAQSNKVEIPTSTAIAASSTTFTATTTVTQSSSSDSKDIETSILTITTSVTSTPPSTVTVTGIATQSSEEFSTLTVTKANSFLGKSTVIDYETVIHYANRMTPPPTYSEYPENLPNRNELSSILVSIADDQGISTNQLGPVRIAMLQTANQNLSMMVSEYWHVSKYCLRPPIPTTNIYYTMVCSMNHPKRSVSNTAMPHEPSLLAYQTLHHATSPSESRSTNAYDIKTSILKILNQQSLSSEAGQVVNSNKRSPTSVSIEDASVETILIHLHAHDATATPKPTYSGFPEKMPNIIDIRATLLVAAGVMGLDTNADYHSIFSELAEVDDTAPLVSELSSVATWCATPPVTTTDAYYSTICLKAGMAHGKRHNIDALPAPRLQQKQSSPTSMINPTVAKHVEKKITTLITVVA